MQASTKPTPPPIHLHLHGPHPLCAETADVLADCPTATPAAFTSGLEVTVRLRTRFCLKSEAGTLIMASAMSMQDHIQDDDLKKYFLGMIMDQRHREQIEIHLQVCPLCSLKAVWTRTYVVAMKESRLRLRGSDGGPNED
jgi:hypothetical protein